MVRMLGLAALLVGVGTLAAIGAGADDWVVVQSSGEIYVQSSGFQLASLSSGPTTLAPGSVLLTAPTGRLCGGVLATGLSARQRRRPARNQRQP